MSIQEGNLQVGEWRQNLEVREDSLGNDMNSEIGHTALRFAPRSRKN